MSTQIDGDELRSLLSVVKRPSRYIGGEWGSGPVKEGKDLLIGFNPKFLIDALRVIDDEEVTIYLMNAKAPCFIKDDEESYIYLILPFNFNAAA